MGYRLIIYYSFGGGVLELNQADIIEDVLEGYIFSEKKVTDECKIYTIKNSNGCGEMRCYNLFEGVQLSYNNLNMETAYQQKNKWDFQYLLI